MFSLSGTPSAGRKLVYLTSSDTWINAGNINGSGTDNGDCYGEGDAACTGNTGLVMAAGSHYVFTNAGWTSSKDWFTDHSYLGSTGDLTDSGSDDLWASK